MLDFLVQLWYNVAMENKPEYTKLNEEDIMLHSMFCTWCCTEAGVTEMPNCTEPIPREIIDISLFIRTFGESIEENK